MNTAQILTHEAIVASLAIVIVFALTLHPTSYKWLVLIVGLLFGGIGLPVKFILSVQKVWLQNINICISIGEILHSFLLGGFWNYQSELVSHIGSYSIGFVHLRISFSPQNIDVAHGQKNITFAINSSNKTDDNRLPNVSGRNLLYFIDYFTTKCAACSFILMFTDTMFPNQQFAGLWMLHLPRINIFSIRTLSSKTLSFSSSLSLIFLEIRLKMRQKY